MSKAVFLGSKPLGLEVLSSMLNHDPTSVAHVQLMDDRHDTRSCFDGFVATCELYELPYTVVQDKRESEDNLRSLDFDLAIISGWYWIFPQSIFDLAPLGFFGIHNSLLPSYAGSAPVVWAMINGEEEIGATLFKMTDDIDKGPIYGRASVRVESQDYVRHVLTKLTTEVGAMMHARYPVLLDGTAESFFKSRNIKPSHGCPRRLADGRLDFNKTAVRLWREVKAQSHPYPGAWVATSENNGINDTRFLPYFPVFTAFLATGNWYGKIGEVAHVVDDLRTVICANNKAIILQITDSLGPRLGEVLR